MIINYVIEKVIEKIQDKIVNFSRDPNRNYSKAVSIKLE
jgi:hypothetical protein